MTEALADTERVRWADPGDAEAVAARIAALVALPGPKRLALPGGSTPLKVFEKLAARDLDWRGTTLTLTDDRRVPDDHPASNQGRLVAALGDSGAAFERLKAGMAVAPFDLVWIGMGEDGHVASLFPQMQAEERAAPSVIATVPEPLPPEAPFPRLSLNPAALLSTLELIVVVTGASKRERIERALEGAAPDLPIADMLSGEGPPVTIYWSE